jgi:hypothetical protein
MTRPTSSAPPAARAWSSAPRRPLFPSAGGSRVAKGPPCLAFGFLNDKSPISERRSFNGDVSPSRQNFFFWQKKKKTLWRLPRLRRGPHIATLISFSTTYIFCFFLEGLYFRQFGFSHDFLTKSSMTEGNEITLRGTSPPSPQNTLRERRVCACYQRLNSAPAGSGAAATAMRALHGLGAKQPAIGLAPAAAPLCGKGGRERDQAGWKKRGGRGKGTLGEGKSVIDEE